MAVTIIALNNSNRSGTVDLRKVSFGAQVEIAANGDFGIDGYILVSRKIGSVVIPVCISWTNQTTLATITEAVSGLTLNQLQHEEELQFDLIGGTNPNLNLYIIGVGT